MLAINNLQYELHDEPLFEPLSFSLAPGESLQLSGINGVGKSTTLKILAGLTKPRRGSILWQGQKVPSLSKISCYLGHELGLNHSLTVQENLLFYAKLQAVSEPDIIKSCEYFDLIPHLHKPIAHLSAGLKRRCQLTKLLLRKKPVWILDESFTSLDQNTAGKLLALFKSYLDTQGMIIFTSHQPITIPGIEVKDLMMTLYL